MGRRHRRGGELLQEAELTAYYNEFDPRAAAWLRELIRQGHLAPGDVDERSIEDVNPDDLRPYDQCHFFAGIGVWSYALRSAGWADDRPVWTGSCPCQPFSAAGKGAGFADERHLWPAFHHLISICRPPVVFGEQVASKDGLGWLDLVQADLEGSGYASGAVDLCAAGVGAPHIRQRLWWVAERLANTAPEQFDRAGRGGARRGLEHPDCGAVDFVEHATSDGRIERRAEPSRGSLASGRGLGGMADRDDAGLEGRGQPGRERAAERLAGQDSVAGGLAHSKHTIRGPLGQHREDGHHGSNGGREEAHGITGTCGEVCGVGDTVRDGTGPVTGDGAGTQSAAVRDDGRASRPRVAARDASTIGGSGPVNGVWRDADWLYCRDGKWRPVEPGSFPLAHGAPARVGRLRGYGNAIVAPAAQAFVEAYQETLDDRT